MNCPHRTCNPVRIAYAGPPDRIGASYAARCAIFHLPPRGSVVGLSALDPLLETHTSDEIDRGRWSVSARPDDPSKGAVSSTPTPVVRATRGGAL